MKSPDRLARSTTDLLALVEQLKTKGVALEFIDNPALNTDTPQGEFMLTVLAAIAQLERRPFVSVRLRALPLPSGTASMTGSRSFHRNRSSWQGNGLPRECPKPRWRGIWASRGRRCTPP